MQHSTNRSTTTIEKKAQVLRKALLNCVEKLAISRQQLCLIMGISEATISRLYKGSSHLSPNSKDWEYATILLRIFRSLDTLFGGNEEQCRLWFHAYNHYFSAEPIELVKSISGLVMVANYLDAMRGKI